ncbi:hypothetical protein LINPERPRIM_LOCUS23788 [Linum perenne]
MCLEFLRQGCFLQSTFGSLAFDGRFMRACFWCHCFKGRKASFGCWQLKLLTSLIWLGFTAAESGEWC